MLSINIGPLAIPTQLALVYLGLFCAWLTGWWLGRKRQANPEAALFNILLIGVLAARIGFVSSYAELYASNWLTALDIRDGGFQPLAGMLAGLVAAIWYFWRKPLLRMPLATGLTVGVLVSGMGLAVLHAMQQGQKMPELALRDISGAPVNLHDYLDQPVVINLWATWCPPCRREMPALQQAQQQNPDIHFLFVNQGESQQQVEQFFRQQNIQLDNALLDSGARVGQAVSSLSLPTTLFYDASGNLQNTHLGELSSASLQHALRKIQPSNHKD